MISRLPFVFVLAACSFADDPQAAPCGDAGCPAGQECYRGFCVPRPERECSDEGLVAECYTGPSDTVGVGACRAGTQTCSGGAWAECVGELVPRLEICNEVDDDCDGRVDELAEAACETGELGRCAEGTLACDEGAARCAPVASPTGETCDARDEDCDGAVDEHLDAACYPTGVGGCAASEEGYACQGVCEPGARVCTGGALGVCTGAVTPRSAVDSCTDPANLATDDDCDGQTDEDCSCIPGTTQRCYAGPADTVGVGICREGVQRCIVESGASRLGPCEGAVVPGTETCGNPGTDDDCDGTVDDVRTLGGACTVPGARGECERGTRRCVAGELQCIGAAASSEVCDGRDDDCDGRIDEDFDVSSDPLHCGACGVRCGAGRTCCGGSCVTLSSDATHCGACGRACGAGMSCCDGACVNTTTDAMNCGTCGRTCPGTTSCCGGTCVELGTDPNHCGACSRMCATGERCCGRACAAPTAPACTGCPTDCSLTGQSCCSGVCVTLASSPLHCGMCGRSCAAGELCCSGMCVPSSTTHCGMCGRACAAGESCVMGACCPTASVCGGACRDLMNDSTNCGMCGRACTAPATCRMGCCCVGTTCDCGVTP